MNNFFIFKTSTRCTAHYPVAIANGAEKFGCRCVRDFGHEGEHRASYGLYIETMEQKVFDKMERTFPHMYYRKDYE